MTVTFFFFVSVRCPVMSSHFIARCTNKHDMVCLSFEGENNAKPCSPMTFDRPSRVLRCHLTASNVITFSTFLFSYGVDIHVTSGHIGQTQVTCLKAQNAGSPHITTCSPMSTANLAVTCVRETTFAQPCQSMNALSCCVMRREHASDMLCHDERCSGKSQHVDHCDCFVGIVMSYLHAHANDR